MSETKEFSELLTARTIIAAFNQCCYATQTAVLEALDHLHEERRKAFYASQEPPPVKTIPLYDPKEAKRLAAEEYARDHPPDPSKKPSFKLATVEEMLKPHPHIGKTKPKWQS